MLFLLHLSPFLLLPLYISTQHSLTVLGFVRVRCADQEESFQHSRYRPDYKGVVELLAQYYSRVPPTHTVSLILWYAVSE